jgi:sugar phosphate isomerase/epimerase
LLDSVALARQVLRLVCLARRLKGIAMELSFSTLGCPAWSIEEITRNGHKWGYQAADIRGIQGEMDLTRIPALNADREATRKAFADAGMVIAMLNTSCRFTSPGADERSTNLQAGKAAIDLCTRFDTGMIRVFGGPIKEGVDKDEAYCWVIDNLKRLGDYGAQKQVLVTIETHDDFTDTYLMRDIMERTDHDWVRVLWDVHHPYRTCGQSMQECWGNLGRYVVHTHFKDSRLDPTHKSGFRYCLMGEGDVPNIDALRLLKAGGYDGYLALEWEKGWHDYLPDASIAFPHYAETMHGYLAKLDREA